MDQMKREMNQLGGQRLDTSVIAVREEMPSALDAATAAPAAALKPEVVRESLSYNDIEILRALAEENFVYGNLVGLTDKTGLARELVSARLTVLKNLGIIETRINEKNVLHWFVSSRGRQMLGDILTGQEER
jgi:ABC-type histidine transport system ATPase subunit